MIADSIFIDGSSFPVVSINTLIIGSGAAALNAAVCLHEKGVEDIAIITDRLGGGTSNCAGSDKQTYYKLSCAGDAADSPLDMARDLYHGGCMHGDIALCEAQHSLEAFYRLVRLGVPFPHDDYGAYPGYQTDHDPKGRGTSAGPLTSHYMVQALLSEVERLNIRIFNGYEAVKLLTGARKDEKSVVGAIAICAEKVDADDYGVTLFNARNIILATGGPAGIYASSAYPESQTGSHGLALSIGAAAHNLTESQFGLGSVKFRWNVSGSYQQVIPRYISTEQNGGAEREFLGDVFPDMKTLAKAIFLKGYQWPFDVRKVKNYGSSLIDVLVYIETVIKKRRVFLDFRHNPGQDGSLGAFSLTSLDEEVSGCLSKSNALAETPYKRLEKLNQPAIDVYLSNGVDIAREPLEIAVCAQHNNGGLKADIWWESNVRSLFPIGEINGTHGVYRPGGASLNATQVGGMRAAMLIARRLQGMELMKLNEFTKMAGRQISGFITGISRMFEDETAQTCEIEAIRSTIGERTSNCGAIVRELGKIENAVREAREDYRRLKELKLKDRNQLLPALKTIDHCLTHIVYLEAIIEYLKKDGSSRGSFIVPDPNGEVYYEGLGEEWRFNLCREDDFVSKKILEIIADEDGNVLKQWSDIRPIPKQDLWFENVWRRFREERE